VCMCVCVWKPELLRPYFWLKYLSDILVPHIGWQLRQWPCWPDLTLILLLFCFHPYFYELHSNLNKNKKKILFGIRKYKTLTYAVCIFKLLEKISQGVKCEDAILLHDHVVVSS
jgi:hypothetical protein